MKTNEGTYLISLECYILNIFIVMLHGFLSSVCLTLYNITKAWLYSLHLQSSLVPEHTDISRVDLSVTWGGKQGLLAVPFFFSLRRRFFEVTNSKTEISFSQQTVQVSPTSARIISAQNTSNKATGLFRNYTCNYSYKTEFIAIHADRRFRIQVTFRKTC